MFNFTFQGNSRRKILYVLVAGITFPALAISVFNLISSRSYLINSVLNTMQTEGSSSEEIIELLLDNFSSDIVYLSETYAVENLTIGENINIIAGEDAADLQAQQEAARQEWLGRLNNVFLAFLQNRPYYDQLRFLDNNGQELVRVNIQNGEATLVSQAQLQVKDSTTYFQETIQLPPGQIYVSDINLNRENGEIEIPYKPVIRYAIPVYNDRGEAEGIIVANILVERLLEIAENETLQNEYQTEVFVVNSEGFYLSHPNPDKEWGFEFNRNENIQQDYPLELFREILSQESGLITENSDYIYSYHTILPENNLEKSFTIIYQTPKNVVFAPLREFVRATIIITVVVGGIFLVIAVILLRRITTSIIDLVSNIGGFSSEAIATIDQQEHIANQQLSAVQETTVTMDQLSSSSQQSSRQAEAAVSSAKQALDRIEQGNQAVVRVLDEMDLLKARVHEITQQILNLSQQTHQIGSISDVVNDLSNQTNMLALNAAVEAIRAGEQGKGFGVVAAEIRKLSNDSRQSSEKINTLVRDIQQMIESTVSMVEKGSKNVESGVKISQQTAQVFLDVAESMQNIVEGSQSIAMVSKQQALATEQVNQAMNNLTRGANETAQGINQIKTGSERLNDAAYKLKEIL
ncbi:MAG: methyl-accepting chemotaxis protein [Spirulinaceae cyanobacterium]